MLISVPRLADFLKLRTVSLLLARAMWKCPIPQAMTAGSGDRSTGTTGGRRADVTLRPCSLCCVSGTCAFRQVTDMETCVNIWLKKILLSVKFSFPHRFLHQCAPAVLHRDSTSHTCKPPPQLLYCACVASCSSRSFLLGCPGFEMLLTLSVSCTVSSSSSHSIFSSSASPPTFRVRLSPSSSNLFVCRF